MRVPDEMALGQARVRISLEGWPEGRVVPSTYQLAVVPRKPLPAIKVSPEQQRVWTADGYSINELQYTPDGRTLVVVMSKRMQRGRLYQFRLWDAATGTERCKCFQIDPEPLTAIYTPYLAISRGSKLLAIRYNLLRYFKEGKGYRDEESGPLHVFDLETGRERWHHDGGGWSIGDAAFSPDGLTIVTAHTRCEKTGQGREQKREFSGEMRFWDSVTGARKPNLPGEPHQIIWRVEYSPDGKYVVFTDEHRGEHSECHLCVWDLAAQKVKLRSTGMNQKAVFSADGERVAIGTCIWMPDASIYRKDVKIWDVQTGKEKACLPLPTDKAGLSGLVWSADGRNLYVSSHLGELWRWNLAGGQPLVQVESISPAPAGEQLTRNAWSQDVHLRSGLYAFAVNGRLPERITRRNLAEDYEELPPPEIVLWDLKTMERWKTFTGHRGQINHIAFSPDGKTLVSGGTDGTVRFWRVAAFQDP